MAQLRMQAARHQRMVQRKSARDAAGGAKIPAGGGAPLASDVRARMEPRLGADLSQVKVHTSGESASAAERLGARAFTTDGEVHFGAGQFAPGTKEGDRLLAHELTHVVQGQRSGVQRKAEPDGDHGGEGEQGAEVSHPDEPAEKEADAVADQVTDSLHGDEQAGAGKKEGKKSDKDKDKQKGKEKDKQKGKEKDKAKGKQKAGGEAHADSDAETHAAGEEGDEKAADGDGAPAGEGRGGPTAGGEDAQAAGGKDGDAAAGGATKQEPAPIAAKLHGVGRKIFRNAAGAPPISASLPTTGAKIFRKWIESKDLPNDKKGPTTDPAHPHLKEMGVTNLGPYKYFPMKGEFQYTPPADLNDLWADTEATKSYQPEAPAVPQAEAKAADKTARIAKAKQKFGPGIEAILAHDDGKTARPFQTVQDEDTRGAAQDAHNVQRHCLSAASDMKSKQDVALRAAFGMIGGVVKGVYTPVASAFESTAAANTAIAGPLNAQMTTNWLNWRVQLAAGKNPFSPVLGAGGGGAVIYKSVSGGQLPVAEVPKYLGLDPAHKGISPLWAGDVRWQQWWDTNPPERKAFEKDNGLNAKPAPLTTDGSAAATGVSMRVLADPTLTNGGWILHAAWPT